MSDTGVVSFVFKFKGTDTNDAIREIAEGVARRVVDDYDGHGDYVIDAANVVIEFMEGIDRDKISQVEVTLESCLEGYEWSYSLMATFTTLNGKTFEYYDRQSGCSCNEFEYWNFDHNSADDGELYEEFNEEREKFGNIDEEYPEHLSSWENFLNHKLEYCNDLTPPVRSGELTKPATKK
jgi:uncharacterized surface anchored protein